MIKKTFVFFCLLLNLQYVNLLGSEFTEKNFVRYVDWPCEKDAGCDLTPHEMNVGPSVKIESFFDSINTKIGAGAVVTAALVAAAVIIYKRIKNHKKNTAENSLVS